MCPLDIGPWDSPNAISEAMKWAAGVGWSFWLDGHETTLDAAIACVQDDLDVALEARRGPFAVREYSDSVDCWGLLVQMGASLEWSPYDGKWHADIMSPRERMHIADDVPAAAIYRLSTEWAAAGSVPPILLRDEDKGATMTTALARIRMEHALRRLGLVDLDDSNAPALANVWLHGDRVVVRILVIGGNDAGAVNHQYTMDIEQCMSVVDILSAWHEAQEDSGSLGSPLREVLDVLKAAVE